jgi:hypothetical protein
MLEGRVICSTVGPSSRAMPHDGKGGVNRFEFRPLDGFADVLPLAAPRQVCHTALKDAVEHDPAILVQQGQGLHSVHKGARAVRAGVCSCLLECCGADRRACG